MSAERLASALVACESLLQCWHRRFGTNNDLRLVNFRLLAIGLPLHFRTYANGQAKRYPVLFMVSIYGGVAAHFP